MTTLINALTHSIIILGIYVAFDLQNAFGWLRSFFANMLDKWFGKKRSMFIQKPIWECYPCMASFWTIIIHLVTGDLMTMVKGAPVEFALLILLVCGINKVIECLIDLE